MDNAGLLALLSAVIYGISHVFTRKSLTLVNAVTCTEFALCVNAVIIWGLTFLLIPGSIEYSPGVLVLMLEGIFLSTFGRFFLYVGFDRVGVARAAPISGISPFFSVILAMLFLKERLTLPISLGTVGIVIGIILLSQKGGNGKWRRVDLFFPLLAALLWGLAPVARKWGLVLGVHPIFGAAIGSTASAIFFPLIVSAGGRSQLHLDREAIPYLLPAGILNGIGFLLVYLALSLGDVVFVTPVANVYPLFSIGFSFIFIRSIERVTVKIFVGALLMLASVTVVLAGPAILNYLQVLF